MTKLSTVQGSVGIIETGGGDRTPILFLHPVGSDKSVWQPQLDHFGRTRRVIAIDFPGYGESDFRADATRDDYAATAVAVLDALSIEQAHICGLSLGGVIAIATHHLAPHRCASLIIADSFAVHPEGRTIYDRSIAAIQTMTLAELAAARAPSILGAAASDELKREIVDAMGRIDPAAFRIGAEAVWLADQRDRAAAIDAPTLILVGDEDHVTPPALSEELGRLIPGSLVGTIPYSGHLANAEQPEAFNAAIDRFLAKVEAHLSD